MRGRWSPIIAAAFLVATSACSSQCGTRPTPLANKSAASSPTPSSNPSPTARLQISAGSLHAGEVGVSYSPVTPAAAGGVAPYAWKISGGSLPPGLSLQSDGTITGTPSAPGSFAFTEQVADSKGSTASADDTVTIAPQLAADLLPACVKYCAVELGCSTVCGPFGQLSGGLGPYAYGLASGVLPAGTSLSGLALAGTFAGLTGYLKFTVQITDSLGGSTTISPTFWMYPHITLTGGAIPTNANTPCWWTGYDPVSAPGCRALFPYSGGTPGAGSVKATASWVSYVCNYQPACTSPPPMPTITVGNGIITVSVPRGYSSGTSGYKGTLTIVLTNQDPCSPGPTACSASGNVTITQASG